MEELKHRVEMLNRLCDLANGQFSKSDYLEAQILLAGLNEAQKNNITVYYGERSWDNYYFVKRVLEMQLPEVDYSKKVDINTPIAELLSNFQNHKSKKVVISRRELIRRYDYLDPTDQLSFRLALLISPSMADNIQGCKYSMERWSGEELPLVEKIWHNAYNEKKYDLWFWSGRILLRHASTEFLLDNQYYLTYFRSEVVSSMYYYLSLRLCKEPTFSLKKENLRIGDYYRILFHSDLLFNEIEWLEDFFRTVAEIYIFSVYYFERFGDFTDVNSTEIARKYTKADEVVPNLNQLIAKPRNEVSLSKLPSIRMMLLYGSLMECEKIVYIMDYLHNVEDKMIEEAKVYTAPDFYSLPKIWSKEQYCYVKSKIVIPCVGPLKSCCPEPFKHCFDERIKEYEEWLAPYVELAERGGYTNMEPVCRSGESYDVAPQIDDFDLDIAFNSCSSELENSPENQQHQDSLELVTDNTDTPF